MSGCLCLLYMQLLGLETVPNRCILTYLLHQCNFGIMQLFCCQCRLDSVCNHWTPIDDWPHNSSCFVAVISYYWAWHPSQIFFTSPYSSKDAPNCPPNGTLWQGWIHQKDLSFLNRTQFFTQPLEKWVQSLSVSNVCWVWPGIEQPAWLICL